MRNKFSLELLPCLLIGINKLLNGSNCVKISLTKNLMSVLIFPISLISVTPSNPPSGWFATITIPLFFGIFSNP